MAEICTQLSRRYALRSYVTQEVCLSAYCIVPRSSCVCRETTMALIPEEGSNDDVYYDYYYDDDYNDYRECRDRSDDDYGVHWPSVVFDVLLATAVIVDVLLVVVVLSSSKLRRGPSAMFIISLAGFDTLHLVSIRVSLHAMWQFEMHPLGNFLCKVKLLTVSVFPPNLSAVHWRF